jgi:hypothetical protein
MDFDRLFLSFFRKTLFEDSPLSGEIRFDLKRSGETAANRLRPIQDPD